uniref:P2X purinoreceptor 7 intracellular domain-containing protein n=1 Tax=Knipowitschia caucasica TaxID=637954 RepID=A0AAV2M3Z6_KNICA
MCTLRRRLRFVAYRSIVSWCWGLLGARIRVVIPACAVLRIRQEFPDPEGQNFLKLSAEVFRHSDSLQLFNKRSWLGEDLSEDEVHQLRTYPAKV